MSQTTSNKITLVDRLDALNEYEREPVKKDQLHGSKTFIAMFSSEHTAGTEFVLGPLLVLHGVSAFDALVGLFVGNILAVLSWALICAPIGVRERLTVYWQIRKMAGPYLTILYSAAFVIVFCLLAGAMVAVSTTAITFPMGIESPDYAAGDRIPNGPWIIVAVLIGIVVALLAVLGFNKIAHFSKVCAPWMPMIFLAGGISCLPMLGDINSFSDFWRVANENIWIGEPVGANSKYGFWSCVGLAWLCNASQHMGMGDVTIFRYAKKWQYGFASAFGMFIGHYMAWIASGIMCAAFIATQTAAGNTPSVNPGTIAWLGAGWAGLICVVLAGWTTANPTLYRAGLAFQTATPNWSRWRVTLVAGGIMIITACIPWVNANLDTIVATYGLFFMPLGALIFIDYWVFPKIGLQKNFSEVKNLLISWPAAVGWLGSYTIGFLLYAKDNYSPFAWVNDVLPTFLANYNADTFMQVLPAWFLAVTLYVVCSYIQQKFTSK